MTYMRPFHEEQTIDLHMHAGKEMPDEVWRAASDDLFSMVEASRLRPVL